MLHTDLPRPEAEQTLARMEATLKIASDYWQCKSRRQIVCYVVEDEANWPDSAFPHALARVWVGGIGGATISQFESVNGRARVKATVYADAKPGTVEHEIIHAYCYQTFGEAGPDWYKEGMAQAVADRAAAVSRGGCPRELVQGLSQQRRRRIPEIVSAGRFTGEIDAALGAMLSDHKLLGQVYLSAWTSKDDETVRQARQHYLWSWSLCHMLLHNPNYNTRFRMLGESYLANGEGTFHELFAAASNEVAFEYAFFLEHMDVDYRVDLCSWEWQERFRTLEQQRVISRRVQASRGFQASGLEVSQGRTYDFTTEGTWSTSADGAFFDAGGDAAGKAKMIGTVLHDFQLSAPFDLGARGTFVAPVSGKLYVRCRDAWSQLADNRGEILLRFTRQP